MSPKGLKLNIPIDVGAGLIFLVSAAVGYAVYRHTRATSIGNPPVGDIGVAFTAGSVILVALAFLFGVSGPDDGQEPAPSPSQSQPAAPTPSSSAAELEVTPMPDPLEPQPAGS